MPIDSIWEGSASTQTRRSCAPALDARLLIIAPFNPSSHQAVRRRDRRWVEPQYYSLAAPPSLKAFPAQSNAVQAPFLFARWRNMALFLSVKRFRLQQDDFSSKRLSTSQESTYPGDLRNTRYANRSRAVMRIVAEHSFRSVGFPLIGAGSGGENPDQVEEIMKREFTSLLFEEEVLIVRFKPTHS